MKSAPRRVCTGLAAFLLLYFCATYSISYGRIRPVPSEYNSIQQAVTNAQTYDTVLVASGTYSGYVNRDIDMSGKRILVMSDDGPSSTIIDCGGYSSANHRAFMFDGSSSTSVEIRGFTIRNGYHESGGAAVATNGASVYFNDCAFEENTSSHNGGAVFAENSTITFNNCKFSGNNGAGLATGGGAAGAVELIGCSASFSGCRFENNSSARNHGAINAVKSALTISNCEIIDNDGYGDYGPHDWNIGAVALGVGSNAEITACVFSHNRGYGLGLSMSKADVSECTFAYNCGGIYTWFGDLSIDKTIIAYGETHRAVDIEGRFDIDVTCSDIYGNAEGNWTGIMARFANKSGNVSADPRFCDGPGGDYHILNYSPCAPDYASCGELVGACDVNCETDYICGDLDFSGIIDIDDVIYVMNYVFTNGIPPMPFEAGNVNCRDFIDVDDTVYLLEYVFLGGAPPCADCK